MSGKVAWATGAGSGSGGMSLPLPQARGVSTPSDPSYGIG